MLYAALFQGLRARQVRYVVVGGVAMVLHGVVRFTADLDLVLAMEPENLGRFLAAMGELGYRPKQPVRPEQFLEPEQRRQWISEKGASVLSFVHPERPMELVDILLSEPIPFVELERERKLLVAQEAEIPVVSVAHLMQLKRQAGRPQDLADVEALEVLRRD